MSVGVDVCGLRMRNMIIEIIDHIELGTYIRITDRYEVVDYVFVSSNDCDNRCEWSVYVHEGFTGRWILVCDRCVHLRTVMGRRAAGCAWYE